MEDREGARRVQRPGPLLSTLSPIQTLFAVRVNEINPVVQMRHGAGHISRQSQCSWRAVDEDQPGWQGSNARKKNYINDTNTQDEHSQGTQEKFHYRKQERTKLLLSVYTAAASWALFGLSSPGREHAPPGVSPTILETPRSWPRSEMEEWEILRQHRTEPCAIRRAYCTIEVA